MRVFLLIGLAGMGFGWVGAMAAEVPRSFVYVCRDAGHGGYEAFPDVCRLADGRLMCVFYAGYAHVSLPSEAWPMGGAIAAVYSADEGKTWSSAVTIYDGPDDDRDPSIAQLRDGRLICSYFSLRKRGESAWEGLGSFVILSEDGGKTWSAPRPVARDYYCSSPVRELADGTLLLGLYRETDKDANGAVTRSEDGGATWSVPVDIPNGGLRLDAETDVIALRDGRLYAAQRTEKESMRYSVSGDGGRTWSVSVPMGFRGHAPYLHRASNGWIVCAHRLPQTALHYSKDECATWSEAVVVDDCIGAYPSLVTRRDASILVVYYEEGAGSNLRARVFRLDGEGLVWVEE